MSGWIVRRTNVAPNTRAFYGPYTTEYGAEAAKERLLKHQSRKIQNNKWTGKGIFNQFFNRNELVIEQVG